MVIGNLDDVPELKDNPDLRSRNIKSCILFPVICGGEAIGALCILSTGHIQGDSLALAACRLMGLALGVEELRRKTENALQSEVDKRISYERLVGEITRDSLKRQSFEDLVNNALTKLGTTLKVSRVYFFRYDRERGIAINAAEWVDEGLEPSRSEFKEMRLDSFPWLREILLSGKDALIEDLNQVADQYLKKMMELEGTKSMLCIPFNVFGMTYGFMGFDECKVNREWRPEDVDLLHSVCYVLAQTIEKERWEDEIIRVERMAAMGRLAGAVAHEINNPLQSIMLYVDLIKDSVAKTPAEKHVNRIEEGVKRITDIVWRVLQLHREKSSEEMIDITDLVKGSHVLIDKQMEQAGIDFDFESKDGIPQVLGNRQLLNQAFLNILLNAMESIEGSGSIRVSAHAEDKWVSIEVRDTGAGIDSDYLPHIFEPFFSSKGKARTGLGLFISHSIITNHGGKIEVQSQRGKGTTVVIRLPIPDTNKIKKTVA